MSKNLRILNKKSSTINFIEIIVEPYNFDLF